MNDRDDKDNEGGSPDSDPIFVYDAKLRESLRAEYPNLNVRQPDGTEPDLRFARVDSLQQVSLPYDRNSPDPIPPQLVQQVALVSTSYANLSSARGADVVLSHVAGISPKQDIVYRRLKAGAIVGSFQSGEYTGALTGSYATPDIGVTLGELGIPTEWAKKKTHFAVFEVTEDHFVLETVAAPFRDAPGGARQYFLTELVDRSRYKPADFSRVPKPSRSIDED